MTQQEQSLRVEWRINPDISVTLRILTGDHLVQQPFVEVQLSAQQVVMLQAEHACRTQGIVWSDTP